MNNMDTFKSYKNDWNYPISIKNPFKPLSSAFVVKPVTFQEVIKVILITGQCFGLNPVLGVCERDASKLRFTFRSWRCLYSMITIMVQSTIVLLCLLRIMKNNESSLSANSDTIFHITNCTTTIIFFRIAMKWPKLCVKIANTESADPNIDAGLPKKCNLYCLVILSLALCEHILSHLAGISIVIDCQNDLNIYRAFMLQSYPWLWTFFPFNYFTAFLSQVLNAQLTFNWNFADLFVICMSMYLTSRLDQVNQRIDAVKNKYVPSSFWRAMREDYNKVTNLVRTVDDIIGGVVFISFANNLFFICLQLLHTLADGIKSSPRCQSTEPDSRPFRGYENAIYFVFSFSFLVVRSVTVSLAASKVHAASKAPAQALYDVSSATYCLEIQRFLDQVHGDTVSLSGLQFFNVKRGIILSIAGTIVTYELVLMQFTGVSPTSSPV